MKIVFFNVREDECELINKFSKKYKIEAIICKESLTIDNVHCCAHAYAISTMTTPVNKELVKKLSEMNIKYLSTRTIGFDHIDLEACKEYDLHVGNVSYSLNSVAEYTVMLILMSLRQSKLILERFNSQDYSLKNIRGRELNQLTVGIIGTGKIGQTVIEKLSSFSTTILAYDVYENEDLKEKVTYVDLKTLYKESDIISLHAPNTMKTFHMINEKTISLMKDDVVLINTARGSLIDTDDLIDALINHQVGYAALDVVENETHLYYKDLKGDIINHKQLALLQFLPNVLLTPHTAFFTNEAVSNMIENSILSSVNMYKGFANPWQII